FWASAGVRGDSAEPRGWTEAGRAIQDVRTFERACAQPARDNRNGDVVDASGGSEPSGSKHHAIGGSESGYPPGPFIERPHLFAACPLSKPQSENALLR